VVAGQPRKSALGLGRIRVPGGPYNRPGGEGPGQCEHPHGWLKGAGASPVMVHPAGWRSGLPSAGSVDTGMFGSVAGSRSGAVVQAAAWTGPLRPGGRRLPQTVFRGLISWRGSEIRARGQTVRPLQGPRGATISYLNVNYVFFRALANHSRLLPFLTPGHGLGRGERCEAVLEVFLRSGGSRWGDDCRGSSGLMEDSWRSAVRGRACAGFGGRGRQRGAPWRIGWLGERNRGCLGRRAAPELVGHRSPD